MSEVPFFFMPVPMPQVWNVGVPPPRPTGAPELEGPHTLARVALPGDMMVRYHTGSTEARVLICRGEPGESAEELVAVLTPEQVGVVARYWLENGVAVRGVIGGAAVAGRRLTPEIVEASADYVRGWNEALELMLEMTYRP